MSDQVCITLWGWTYLQWEKACDYWLLFNEGKERPPVYRLFCEAARIYTGIGVISESVQDPLHDIRDTWASRRNDDPGEITILLE